MITYRCGHTIGHGERHTPIRSYCPVCRDQMQREREMGLSKKGRGRWPKTEGAK